MSLGLNTRPGHGDRVARVPARIAARRLARGLVRRFGVLRAARVLVVVGAGGLARTVGLVACWTLSLRERPADARKDLWANVGV